MIKCHLSTLMGRDKLKVADVANKTGINRSGVTALYKETAKKIELTSVNELCKLFNCQVSDLFEFVDEVNNSGDETSLSNEK